MAIPSEKPVMLIGVDESEHSFYGLEWAIDHFFVPYTPNPPFKLIIVHVKPTAFTVVGAAGPRAVDILPHVDEDLKRIAARVIDDAKEICVRKNVYDDVLFETVEGDPRNILCEYVEKHHASMLVIGSHGYGAIKRAVLGSVSDYCAHHAHCSVTIVKKPKTKH